MAHVNNGNYARYCATTHIIDIEKIIHISVSHRCLYFDNGHKLTDISEVEMNSLVEYINTINEIVSI